MTYAAILIIKFGIAAAYNGVYIANSVFFPTLYLGASYGVVNILSRATTIFAPQVAEIPRPAPMIILAILAGFAAIAGLFLDPHSK